MEEADDETRDVEALDLSRCIWPDIDRSLSQPQYGNLRQLIIKNSQLSSIPILPRSLRLLDVSRNLIENISGLDELPNLRVLRIARNSLRRIDGLLHNNELEELDVSYNCITVLRGLDHLQHLRALDCRYNRLAQVSSIRRIQNNTSLKSLRLEGNELLNSPQYPQFIKSFLSGVEQLSPKHHPRLDAMSPKNSSHPILSGRHNNDTDMPGRMGYSQLHVDQNRRRVTATNPRSPRYMAPTISKRLKVSKDSPQKPAQKYKASSRRHSCSGAVKRRRSSGSMFSMSPDRARRFSSHTLTPIKQPVAESDESPLLSTLPYKKLSREIPNIPDPFTKPTQASNELSEADLEEHLRDLARINDLKSNMAGTRRDEEFGLQGASKQQIKGVIKRLNEKINKLYSWHLVELDLVSRQQMQLNEMRSDLVFTKTSLASVLGASGNPTMRANSATPATPELQPTQEPAQPAAQPAAAPPAHGDSVPNIARGHGESTGKARQALVKCLKLLELEDAGAPEVKALRSVIAKLDRGEVGKTEVVESYQAPPTEQPEPRPKAESSQPSVKANQALRKTETVLQLTGDKMDMLSKNFTEGETDVIMPWLVELEDEIGTARMSLQHLVDITTTGEDNVEERVIEFKQMVEKCEMFEPFLMSEAVAMLIPKGTHRLVKYVGRLTTRLQETKNKIRQLMAAVQNGHMPGHSHTAEADVKTTRMQAIVFLQELEECLPLGMH